MTPNTEKQYRALTHLTEAANGWVSQQDSAFLFNRSDLEWVCEMAKQHAFRIADASILIECFGLFNSPAHYTKKERMNAVEEIIKICADYGRNFTR